MDRPVRAFDDTDLTAVLDDDLQAAFGVASDLVDDQFVEEIASRMATIGPDAGRFSFSSQHLPRRYREHYNVLLVRRVHICFLTVVDHLAQDLWPGLACRAEELALHAILTQLRIDADTTETPIRSLDERLAQVTDAAFDDIDFLFAFDPAADGIDDPDTDAGQLMGIGSLHPRHWFDPFNDRRPHPLVHP